MLLHADNFSIYGGDPDFMLNGIYADNFAVNLDADPDGFSPGTVMRPQNVFTNEFTAWRYVFPTGSSPKVGAAFRMWNYTLPNTNEMDCRIMQWRDNANLVIAEFGVTSTGQVMIWARTSPSVFTAHTSTFPAVTAQGWYHVEAAIQLTGGATLHYEVRIEGIVVLEGDAARDGAFAGIAQMAAYTKQINGPQMYAIKDLVFWDNTGTYNNNFLGSVQVVSLVPDADVAVNWSLFGGTTGYEILDNAPPNAAQYIYALNSPAPAGPYSCSLTDLPVDVSSVKGLITYARAGKNDGGDGSLQVGLISVGNTVLGANRPITVAQTYWRDVFETDPATTALWLPGAVNLVTLQIDRTA